MRNKVSLKKCLNYDYLELIEVLKKSFDNLGGIDKFLNKGDRVLLKLNLLMKSKPESAVTVHPLFVKAISKILLDNEINVIIGDSPGGPFNKILLKSIYKDTGMNQIVTELNEYIDNNNIKASIKLNDNFKSFEKKNKNGKILNKLTLVDMLNDVDKVISISKLKTHGMMVFTGAVKNLFGTVPGVLKAEYHFKMSELKDFANMLIDICEIVNPVLSFMDAIIGMEGEGPSSGHPRKIGAVIASKSPFHLDMIATDLISLNHRRVPTISESFNRNICEENYDDIELIGEKVKIFKISNFIIPESYGLNFAGKGPKFLQNLLTKLARPKPVFNKRGCIGCRICYEACPPKTIFMENNKAVVNLDNCIRCFCCQELCPEKTIDIHRPLLMKLLARF